MSQFFTRLFGGAPTRTLIKLLLASLLVGLILSKMGWTAWEVPERLWYVFLELLRWGYKSFGKFFDMILIGAIIVLPVFIIRRLVSGGKT